MPNRNPERSRLTPMLTPTPMSVPAPPAGSPGLARSSHCRFATLAPSASPNADLPRALTDRERNDAIDANRGEPCRDERKDSEQGGAEAIRGFGLGHDLVQGQDLGERLVTIDRSATALRTGSRIGGRIDRGSHHEQLKWRRALRVAHIHRRPLGRVAECGEALVRDDADDFPADVRTKLTGRRRARSAASSGAGRADLRGESIFAPSIR